MIVLIFFIFYCVNVFSAQHEKILKDYIQAVNCNFNPHLIVGPAIEVISSFHKTFRHALPDDQQFMVECLILGDLNPRKNSLLNQIPNQAKKICQDATLQRSKLAVNYTKKLASPFVQKDIFYDPSIRFYHQFIAYSIDPGDQLYYQIEYVKGLNLSGEVKSYLIMSLVDNVQSPLFAEQEKKAPHDVIFKVAHYYDKTISEDLIKSYFQLKSNFESQLNPKDVHRLLDAQIIEKQKIFLMAIAYLRGFYADSSFVLFAKDADGDCGNYCIDVYNINKEEKYGAINSISFLQQNADKLTIETINRLYPSQSNGNDQPNEQIDIQGPQKRFILVRVMQLIFCFLKMIYQYWCSFWMTQQSDLSRNGNQVFTQAKSPIQVKHPSVREEQYKKIKLQIDHFKSNRNYDQQFKAFLKLLYVNEDYSIDYGTCWFKYWHVKEALVAHLLKIKIRFFTGYDQIEEITQQEPCYDDGSREIYVWTDNTAYHDSELVPFYCFALMAKALRFENRYFGSNPRKNDYLVSLQRKFDSYKKDWIKIRS